MPDLFTTYESIQPPEIVSPDVQQNYQEIQSMQQPDQNKQDDPGIDWSFIETPSQDLEQPKFDQQISQQQNNSSAAQSVINLARQFVGGKYSLYTVILRELFQRNNLKDLSSQWDLVIHTFITHCQIIRCHRLYIQKNICLKMVLQITGFHTMSLMEIQ